MSMLETGFLPGSRRTGKVRKCIVQNDIGNFCRKLRVLMKLVGMAMVLTLLPLFAVAQQNVDVVVVGATPGGIASAVTAARLGHSVALVEYQNHLGAMSASGLGKSDIKTREAIGGFFKEFIHKVHQDYLQYYAPDSKQVRLCGEGYYYEPSVAERVFTTMVKKENITVFLGYRLDEVIRSDKKVVGIRVVNRESGERIEFRGKIFIDATYEGDVAAYAGADYMLGRESRREFDEPHAGVIYMDHTTRSLLPGTSGKGDDRLPAYTFRLCLTTNPKNRIKPEKPKNYNRNLYVNYFKDLELGRIPSVLWAFSLSEIPNEKFDTNMKPWPLGFPFAGENVGYPEASWQEREKIIAHIRDITLGLFYFIQNDPQVSAKDKALTNKYGFAKDEFIDNKHFPWQLYVREARRIVGEYILTENDMTLAPESGRAPVFADAISSGEFPIDAFPTRKYELGHETALEGYILMLKRFTQPYQIPYRVMIPKKVDNLIVPVAVSTTHIAFSSVRMEPAWMALGQAAGTAASLAIENNVTPRKISVDQLQRLLVENGQVITYFKDISECGEALPAIQYFGTKGFFDDYYARPHEALRRGKATHWFRLALELAGVSLNPKSGAYLHWRDLNNGDPYHDAVALALLGIVEKPGDQALFRPDDPLKGDELNAWLERAAAFFHKDSQPQSFTGSVTVAAFCRSMYRALDKTRETEPKVQNFIGLPDSFQRHTFHYKNGKLSLLYRPGNGTPLVLIHGSFLDASQWTETIKYLPPKMPIVLIELRGHGKSWPPNPNTTIEELAQETLWILSQVGIDKFYAGGHSIGGMVALELGRAAPERVKAIISVEGWTYYRAQKKAFGKAKKDKTQKPQYCAVDRERILEKWGRERMTAFGHIWRKWDGLQFLRTTEIPVLEIYGDRGLKPRPSLDDLYIPKRKNITFVWIANAPHNLPCSKPQELGRIIWKFLAKV